MPATKYRAIKIPATSPPEVVHVSFDDIANEIEVGYVEPIRYDGEHYLLAHEEGRWRGLPFNEIATLLHSAEVVGPVFLVGDGATDFDDVKQYAVDTVMALASELAAR